MTFEFLEAPAFLGRGLGVELVIVIITFVVVILVVVAIVVTFVVVIAMVVIAVIVTIIRVRVIVSDCWLWSGGYRRLLVYHPVEHHSRRLIHVSGDD